MTTDIDDFFRSIRLGFDIPPVGDLSRVQRTETVLHVTRHTRGLDRLLEFICLRTLNAHDMTNADFQSLCKAEHIEYFGANIFGVTTLDGIENLVNLKGLELTDNTQLKDITRIGKLSKLEVFALANCPITIDLAALSMCNNLRCIWLSSSYAKPMRVQSLAPLAVLSNLEVLKIKNVRVMDKKLKSLCNLRQLKVLELPDYFTLAEFSALEIALPNTTGRWKQRIESKRG